MLTLTPLRFTAVLARSGGQPTVCPTVRTQQGAHWRGRALSHLRGLKRRDRGARLAAPEAFDTYTYICNERSFVQHVCCMVCSGWCWRSEAPQLERSLSLRRRSCTQFVPRLLPRAFRVFSVFVVFFLAYRNRFSRARPLRPSGDIPSRSACSKLRQQRAQAAVTAAAATGCVSSSSIAMMDTHVVLSVNTSQRVSSNSRPLPSDSHRDGGQSRQHSPAPPSQTRLHPRPPQARESRRGAPRRPPSLLLRPARWKRHIP